MLMFQMFLRYPWQQGEYNNKKTSGSLFMSWHWYRVVQTGSPTLQPPPGKSLLPPLHRVTHLLDSHSIKTSTSGVQPGQAPETEQIHFHRTNGRSLLIWFTTARKSAHRALRRYCSFIVFNLSAGLKIGVVKAFCKSDIGYFTPSKLFNPEKNVSVAVKSEIYRKRPKETMTMCFIPYSPSWWKQVLHTCLQAPITL